MSSSSSSSSSSSRATTTTNDNWLVGRWNSFHDGHERLKNSVHSYWRQNTILSPRGTAGKVVMGCVYFSIPVVLGYTLFTSIVERSEPGVQQRLYRQQQEQQQPSSNQETSKNVNTNTINLERFLKKQRKLKERRDREAAEQQE